MRIGSLFSGIGGLELGLEWSGLGRTVWQVERDPYCRAVLAKHWPAAERFDDVCTVGASTLAPVDLICGGFPCQDVSGAGKGAGLAGERSGLWREYARIVGELQPRWVVVENVLSGASRWLDVVVRNLEELGYAALPVPLAAEDVGAPHRRRRVFIVARSAHSDRNELREQSGWWAGSPGSTPSLARIDGARGDVADPNGVRELQPERRIGEQWRRSSDGSWWSTEPDVGRVAHGVPARAHRLRALGNAVVPQCAEVVGWVIREIEGW